MATIDIGKIKPVFRGTYDNSTAYVLDDIVYYNGSSYVAKTSTTGNLPTDTTKWNILASGSGGIWDSNLSIGSTGQVVKVGSGGALEFGTIVSKILGTSYISYGGRIQPPQSPSGANGYSGTTNIFPSNTFQYTKTIQNSHLQGWLVISGMGGGQTHHGRGTVSFSIDGSTVTNSHVVSTSTSTSINGNLSTYLFKVANNSSAGTITIDPRYGGNGNRFWDIINPNANDNNEYSVATGCYMFIMEVAN